MGDLLARLDAELYRVDREAQDRDRDARGILRQRRGGQGIDIYAHPEAIMHFKRALEPMAAFELRDPKTMPPNAIGKYRDCWVFADASQPNGALMILIDGNVIADVPISLNQGGGAER